MFVFIQNCVGTHTVIPRSIINDKSIRNKNVENLITKLYLVEFLS